MVRSVVVLPRISSAAGIVDTQASGQKVRIGSRVGAMHASERVPTKGKGLNGGERSKRAKR